MQWGTSAQKVVMHFMVKVIQTMFKIKIVLFESDDITTTLMEAN